MTDMSPFVRTEVPQKPEYLSFHRPCMYSAGPNAFLKPQRIAMYGISCIGFIGCESDQNTDRTAHSAAFTDWMRNMQLLMIIQGNSLIVQMCS